MSRSRTRLHAKEREDLSQRLWEWAGVEMGLSGDFLPSQEELKILVGGGWSGLWSHVLSHMQSPRHAELVRQNLLIHSVGVAGSGDVLLEQRSQLSQERSSLRMALAQMGNDVSGLRRDIAQVDLRNSSVRDDVAQLSQKTALLAAHSIQCQEMTHVLNEFTKHIQQRVEVFRRSQGESSYFACSRGPSSVVLESACTRQVRGVCQQVEQLLGLHDGGQSADQEHLRQQVWNKVECLLSRYAPQEILSSLREVTHSSEEDVHRHTTTIDLKKDAEQLKYHYDHTGAVSDDTEKPGLLHTVEEHLLDGQLSHIRRSVESEKAQRGTKEAQQRLQEVKGQAEQLLSLQYQQDPAGNELARSNFHLDLEECGCRFSLAALSSLCADLGSARDQRRTAMDQLHDKHKRIQEFTYVAECKQGDIQSLVKHNSAARDRLHRQKTELELYLRESVCGHEGPLVTGARWLMDGVLREVRLFSTLSLARMVKPPGIDTLVCELSINRLEAIQPSGHPTWDKILEALGLSAHSAPERVIPKLLNLLKKVDGMRREVEQRNRVSMETKAAGVDRQQAEGVLAAARKYDCDQLEEGIPALRRCLSQASQGLASYGRVQQTLEEWWNQPAQYSTPWVTYEGMSMDDWVKQWRILATKLRQHSASEHC